jgi:hypothetical protein
MMENSGLLGEPLLFLLREDEEGKGFLAHPHFHALSKLWSSVSKQGWSGGKELYIDGTKVQANASKDSLKPRFFVEAHLAHLFDAAPEGPQEEGDQRTPPEAGSSQPVEQETHVPLLLPVSLSQQAGSQARGTITCGYLCAS